MTDLPKPSEPFTGGVGRLYGEASPRKLNLSQPAKGKPNVLLVMLDDVGFGSFSAFGGEIPSPGVDKVARSGLKFNQFHTTALCSPTRAALLTGRNHHSVHMGGITEIANSFPAYDSVIPKESATMAEVLKSSGYNTACFGKWHLTPSWDKILRVLMTGGQRVLASSGSMAFWVQRRATGNHPFMIKSHQSSPILVGTITISQRI